MKGYKLFQEWLNFVLYTAAPNVIRLDELGHVSLSYGLCDCCLELSLSLSSWAAIVSRCGGVAKVGVFKLIKGKELGVRI